MYIDPQTEDSEYYEVIDYMTGEKILGCVWADDSVGKYGVIARDEEGRVRYKKAPFGQEAIIEERRGSILIVDVRKVGYGN